MSRLAALLAPHHRLSLFWLCAALGLAGPWLLTGVDWGHWIASGKGNARTCFVASIHDGDTLSAICDGDQLQVGLYCIDAPELAQNPWGIESRDHLRQLVPREVTLRLHETDRYGRKIAEVLTPEGESVNQRMVRDGQAAVYRQFCPDAAFIRLEAAAKTQGLGIWAQPGEHQAPWHYRHRDR